MPDNRAEDRAAFFLLGVAIGAVGALLMAPASATHSPEISPQGRRSRGLFDRRE